MNSLVVIRFLSDGDADLEVVYRRIRLALVGYSPKGQYLVNLVE